jgi:hypothetical protein
MHAPRLCLLVDRRRESLQDQKPALVLMPSRLTT